MRVKRHVSIRVIVMVTRYRILCVQAQCENKLYVSCVVCTVHNWVQWDTIHSCFRTCSVLCVCVLKCSRVPICKRSGVHSPCLHLWMSWISSTLFTHKLFSFQLTIQNWISLNRFFTFQYWKIYTSMNTTTTICFVTMPVNVGVHGAKLNIGPT